jgi:hypothetical protein
LTEEGVQDTGRLTPVRALLAQQMASRNGEPEACLDHQDAMFGLNSESSDNSIQDVSLKGLIEAATGIPAQRQQIVASCRGPLQVAIRSLYEYDIGHGSTLLLSVKSTGTRQDVQFLASPALKREFDTHHSDFIFKHMSDFMNSKVTLGSREAKDLLEPLPDWSTSFPPAHRGVGIETPSDIMFQDYSFLTDNNIFDLTGRIRKQFHSLPRVAKASSASHRLRPPGTPRFPPGTPRF